MIKASELEKYIGVLPYDSELFGVYQSLLGWKSKRAERRFGRGLSADKSQALRVLASAFNPKAEVRFHGTCEVEFTLRPGELIGGDLRTFDSYLMTELARELPSVTDLRPELWVDLLHPDRVGQLMSDTVPALIREHWREVCGGLRDPPASRRRSRS